ncbi:hypothetical protein A2U01_0030312, partial [Trifolium medium]|nr:hypothetical protein [Trifolium medium]
TGICGEGCCACDELPGPDLDFAPFVLLGFFVGFSTGGDVAGCLFLPMAFWLRVSWVLVKALGLLMEDLVFGGDEEDEDKEEE